MGGWGPFTVGQIANVFEDNGFVSAAQVEPEQGVRRTTAAEYLAAIDWDDPDQRKRLLQVAGEVLAYYPEEDGKPGDPGQRLRRTLDWARAQVAEEPVGAIQETSEFQRTTDRDDPFDIWPDGRIRLFLSHTNAHKGLVASVATALETWPFACFVAHEEIEPSLEWQEVIESALATCHALVAFSSDDFRASAWCDQEVGWAFGRGLVVIPVRLTTQPHGFAGSIQAIRASLETSPGEIAHAVASGLCTAAFRETRAGSALLVEPLADAIVGQFASSPSYELARRRFEFLRRIPTPLWTAERRLRLETAFEENRQIRKPVLASGDSVPDAVRAPWV